MYRSKVVGILVCLGMTGAVLGSHSTSSLWPYFPLFIGLTAVGVFVTVLVFDQPKESYIWALGFVILLAIFYRSYILSFPPSLLGIDPDRKAVNVARIINYGHVTPLRGFYRAAPGFHIHWGIFSIIGDLSAKKSSIVFPIMGGISAPLAAYLLARQFRFLSSAPALSAALIASIAAMSTKLGGAFPIAQSLAVCIWLILFVGIVIYLSSSDYRMLLVVFSMTVALLFIHKIPLFFLLTATTSVAVAGTLIYFSSKFIPDFDRHRVQYGPSLRRIWLLAGSISVLLFIQWDYITGFINSFILHSVLSLFSPALEVSPTIFKPTAAVKANSELGGIILRRMYGLTSLPVAGVVALLLLLSDSDKIVRLFVAVTTLSLIAFLPLSIVTGYLNHSRIFLTAEPLFAVVIGVGLFRVRHYTVDTKISAGAFGAVLFLVSLILITQIGAVMVVPDHPGGAREYLNDEEITAKEFGYNYSDTVHTDNFYAYERPYPDKHVTESGGLVSNRNNTFQPASVGLLNASIKGQCFEAYIQRDVDIIRYQGHWRLTWSPADYFDRNYNNIYSSGSVKIYSGCPLQS